MERIGEKQVVSNAQTSHGSYYRSYNAGNARAGHTRSRIHAVQRGGWQSKSKEVAVKAWIVTYR